MTDNNKFTYLTCTDCSSVGCEKCDPSGSLRQRKRWVEEYHKWKRPNNLITLKEFDHE